MLKNKFSFFFSCVFLFFAWASCPVKAELPKESWELLWATGKDLHPGIRHIELVLQQPRLMHVHAVRIELSNPAIRFVTFQRAHGWGTPMPDYPKMAIRTLRQTTGDFLLECRRGMQDGGRGRPVVFAVNAAPWAPWTTPFTHKYGGNLGALISDGVLVSEPNGRPAFVVTKERKYEFRVIQKEDNISDIALAVSGFFVILKDDQITVGDAPKDLHPRMGYGLSQDRRYFYAVAIDGRQPGYSLGANCHEVAQFLQAFGASDGLNMDGGGSTTMVYWNEQKKSPVLLNCPSKGGVYQRPVGCALGVYYVK